MSDCKVWYRWPEKYYEGRNYVPWFTILRRVVFLPLLAIGISFTFLAVFLGHGLSEAKEFWNKV